MARLFISSASQDGDIAESVRYALEHAGHSCYLSSVQRGQNAPGTAWLEALTHSLRSAHAIIFLGTDSSVRSEWCMAELGGALANDTLLLPVMWPGVTRPRVLEHVQCMELSLVNDDLPTQVLGAISEWGLEGGTRPAWNPHESPYPGLESFGRDRSAVFFGRSEDVRTVMRAWNDPMAPRNGILLISGPAGSGKSSFAEAGVMAALHEAGWRTSPRLRVESSHRATVAAIETSLEQCRSISGSVPGIALSFDQLEDAFDVDRKPAADREQSNTLISYLSKQLNDSSQQLRIVATIRSEFVVDFHRSELASHVLHHVPLGSLTVHQLRQCVEEPTRLSNVALDPDLVSHLLEEGAAPGMLPLLAYALATIVPSHLPHLYRCSLDGLTKLGGVKGLLEQEVIRVCKSVPAAEALLPKFMAIDDRGTLTRRSISVDDLGHDHQALVDQLVDSRVFERDIQDASVVVRPIHVAVLTSLPSLNAILADQRDQIRIRTRIESEAHQWALANSRPDESLSTRERRNAAKQRSRTLLQESREWVRSNPADVTPTMARYMREQVRLHTRRKVALALLVLVAMLAGTLAMYFNQRDSAAREQALRSALVDSWADDARPAIGSGDLALAAKLALGAWSYDDEVGQQLAAEIAWSVLSQRLHVSSVSPSRKYALIGTDTNLSYIFSTDALDTMRLRPIIADRAVWANDSDHLLLVVDTTLRVYSARSEEIRLVTQDFECIDFCNIVPGDDGWIVPAPGTDVLFVPSNSSDEVKVVGGDPTCSTLLECPAVVANSGGWIAYYGASYREVASDGTPSDVHRLEPCPGCTVQAADFGLALEKQTSEESAGRLVDPLPTPCLNAPSSICTLVSPSVVAVGAGGQQVLHAYHQRTWFELVGARWCVAGYCFAPEQLGENWLSQDDSGFLQLSGPAGHTLRSLAPLSVCASSGSCSYPAWSTDGSMVLAQQADGTQAIGDLHDGRVHSTDERAYCGTSPCFSPSGVKNRWIVRQPDGQLAVLERNGELRADLALQSSQAVPLDNGWLVEDATGSLVWVSASAPYPSLVSPVGTSVESSCSPGVAGDTVFSYTTSNAIRLVAGDRVSDLVVSAPSGEDDRCAVPVEYQGQIYTSVRALSIEVLDGQRRQTVQLPGASPCFAADVCRGTPWSSGDALLMLDSEAQVALGWIDGSMSPTPVHAFDRCAEGACPVAGGNSEWAYLHDGGVWRFAPGSEANGTESRLGRCGGSCSILDGSELGWMVSNGVGDLTLFRADGRMIGIGDVSCVDCSVVMSGNGVLVVSGGQAYVYGADGGLIRAFDSDCFECSESDDGWFGLQFESDGYREVFFPRDGGDAQTRTLPKEDCAVRCTSVEFRSGFARMDADGGPYLVSSLSDDQRTSIPLSSVRCDSGCELAGGKNSIIVFDGSSAEVVPEDADLRSHEIRLDCRFSVCDNVEFSPGADGSWFVTDGSKYARVVSPAENGWSEAIVALSPTCLQQRALACAAHTSAGWVVLAGMTGVAMADPLTGHLQYQLGTAPFCSSTLPCSALVPGRDRALVQSANGLLSVLDESGSRPSSLSESGRFCYRAAGPSGEERCMLPISGQAGWMVLTDDGGLEIVGASADDGRPIAIPDASFCSPDPPIGCVRPVAGDGGWVLLTGTNSLVAYDRDGNRTGELEGAVACSDALNCQVAIPLGEGWLAADRDGLLHAYSSDGVPGPRVFGAPICRFACVEPAVIAGRYVVSPAGSDGSGLIYDGLDADVIPVTCEWPCRTLVGTNIVHSGSQIIALDSDEGGLAVRVLIPRFGNGQVLRRLGDSVEVLTDSGVIAFPLAPIEWRRTLCMLVDALPPDGSDVLAIALNSC